MNCAFLSAQTKYYDSSTKIELDSCTYICRVETGSWVVLYNEDFTFGPDCLQVYKSTNKEVSDMDEEWFVDDKEMFNTCNRIWKNTVLPYISEVEAKAVTIEMYISSDTGRVADVVFSFAGFKAVGIIPPSVYRKVEVELKKQLQFTITETGKQVNYIYLMYRPRI